MGPEQITCCATLMNKVIRSLLCAVVIAALPRLVFAAQETDAMLKTIEFLGLTARLPTAWIQENPGSSMRLAQFRIPDGEHRGDSELILYFFGKGQGGSADANIARWQSQFTNASGGAVDPRVENLTISDMPVTVVELSGDYARSIGMGSTVTAKPDQTLLATIVESPRGNVYIQLHGPAGAVATHRDAYMRFIRSIKSQTEQPGSS